MPFGDASPSVRWIVRAFGLVVKNGAFIVGAMLVIVGDLFVGQNYFQTLLLGVSNETLTSVWIFDLSARSITAYCISAMGTMFQIMTYNWVKQKGKISKLDGTQRLSVLTVYFAYVADAIMNFGGLSIMTGGTDHPGGILPANPSFGLLLFQAYLTVILAVGLPLSDTFIGLNEPLLGDRFSFKWGRGKKLQPAA